MPMAVDTDYADLSSPDTFVPGVPFETFDRLRKENPVYFHEEPDGPGFWCVTRYDDLVTVNRDNQLFSSNKRTALFMESDEEMLAQQQLMMLNMDPPMHTRYRLLVNKGFTPRRVSQLEETIRRQTNEIIDSVAENAEADCERLSELELDLFFLLLSVAGNETTRNAISHGMVALSEHPDQQKRLLGDPSLINTAVEEILRWATPVMHFRRQATAPTQIGDQKIGADEKVVFWHISANRDETVFEDPYRFDVGRTPNDHVAFGGGGPHFCLGANLARLEMRVMFEELLRRLPDMQPSGPVQRLRSNFINGIKHMPVQFTKARRESAPRPYAVS